MSTVISVENLSKSYRLGQIGTGTLSRDLEVWWAKVRGKPNPLLKIGQEGYGMDDGGPGTGDRSSVSRLPSFPVPGPPSEILWALKDVSFQVQQGEVLGIIGRNGAGKSTLLKILSRVTAPTSGQVKVRGRIASLLEVGTGFHPELTGRENIFLNGAILGMSKQEVQRKFDEIVSFAEVEKFVDTPVKRYSSGMYVRLAFAVAAHLESEILLVDEVLAVGDAEFQKKCLGKMGDVATNEGRTVLFVSHNMGSVKTLCEAAIYLNKGCLINKDETDEIIKQYLENLEKVNEKGFFDRTGIGGAKINNIQIKSKPNDSSIGISEPFSVEIEIYFERDFKKVNAGIEIKDSYDVQIVNIRSDTQGGIFGPVKKGDTLILEVDIEGLPLYPGNYFFEPWIGEYKGKRVDHIYRAKKIFFVSKGILKAETLIQNRRGYFLVDSNWKQNR